MTDVRVCGVDEVAPNSAVRVDTPGHRLVVVRIQADGGTDSSAEGGIGEWYALDDRCSHAEASLAEGDVWADDREIECPRHGSTFDLRSGKALTLPATRPQGTYAVRVEGDDVIVELP